MHLIALLVFRKPPECPVCRVNFHFLETSLGFKDLRLSQMLYATNLTCCASRVYDAYVCPFTRPSICQGF